MTKESVRFAVRSERGLRAATWNLTVRTGSNKNDVYLFCRPLRGALKASLHESGSWHIGFLRNFAEENFENGHPKRSDPYIERWPRPNAFAPGMTLAYRIVTPSSGVTVPVTDDLPKSIAWIPAAPNGKATEVDIIFTDSGTPVSSWPGKNTKNTKYVGSLTLDKGDSVWIVHHIIDIPKLHIPDVSPSWFRGRSKKDLSGGSLRAILFGNSDDGSRFMVDCAVKPTGNTS